MNLLKGKNSKFLSFSCKNKVLSKPQRSSIILFIIVLMIFVNLIFGQILGIHLKATPSIGSIENPFTARTEFSDIKAQVEAASQGDSFYFEAGIYNFKSDLKISDGIRLIGKSNDGGMENDEVVFLSSANFRHISTKLDKDDSNFTIENIVLLGKLNLPIDDFVGGGIDFSASGTNSKITLNDCRFENNRTTSYGGALNLESGMAEINNRLFKSNVALNGGAIYSSSSSALVINSSSFYLNKADTRGGGVNATDVQVKNSTFVNNISYRDGGGIYIRSGIKSKIEFCTITENEVTRNNSSSGGVYSAENITLFGNIVVGNKATLNPDAKIGNRTDLLDKGFTGAPEYNIMGYHLAGGVSKESIFRDNMLYESNKSIYKMIRYEGKAYRKIPKTSTGVPLLDQRGYPRNEYEMEDFVDVGSIEYRKARNYAFLQNKIIKYEDEASFNIMPLLSGFWDEDILSFTTSHENIAAVSSDGIVTINSKGETTITAKTTSGATANIIFEIIGRPVLIEGIKISKEKLDLKVGEDSYSLFTSALPAEADLPTLVWSTSDSEVAVVNSRGEVTPIKRGECVIKVESEDEKYSAQCQVTVSQPVQEIALSESKISLQVGGDSQTLLCTVLPNDANLKDVTWLSSNVNVATVNSNGVVTPIGKGICEIWVTSNDGSFSVKCDVIVTQPVVEISLDKSEIEAKPGDEFSLKVEYLPFDADGTENYEIVWASDNETSAVVDNSGHVTILSENKNRTVYITAKTADEKCSASCKVVIKAIPVLLTGMPDNGKVEEDSAFVLSGNFSFNSSMGWHFESEFFEASFNGNARFTAKKVGSTTIKYTNGDSFFEFDIEIIAKPTEPTTTTTESTTTTTTTTATESTEPSTTTTTSETTTESEVENTTVSETASKTETSSSIISETTTLLSVSGSNNSNSAQTTSTRGAWGEEDNNVPNTGGRNSIKLYLLISFAFIGVGCGFVIRKKKI